MSDAAPAERSAHPAVYLLLILPFGGTSGFLTVALTYQLKQGGVDDSAIAALVALSYLPHTWKVLWAPLVDSTLTRRRWYLLAAVVCAASLWGTGLAASPVNGLVAMGWLTTLVLLSNTAITFLAMSVESLMAAATPDNLKGRAAGWFQAGNLGGMGLGGGLCLWLMQSQQWSTGAAAALLAVLGLACSAGLLLVHEPPPAGRLPGVVANARALGAGLWALVRSRVGALAVLICFLPIGSGAAQNLWSVVAGDWQAGADTVALVNGALGGVVAAAGCLAGGWVCDRIDRRLAYCGFGLLLAGCAAGMALTPHTTAAFVFWTSLYAFIVGLLYAGYSAVVLEAIGRHAAATRYNLLASLSNMPIAYMTWFNGWLSERGGANQMLLGEAAAGLLGLLLFAAAASRRTTQPTQ